MNAKDFSRVSRLLSKAGLRTLSQVLAALSPLHPALYFDIPAFGALWEHLSLLGLIEQAEGGAEAVRLAHFEPHLSLAPSLDGWRADWAATGGQPHRVRELLLFRHGLDTPSATPRTLEETAVLHNRSRERARQVEKNALIQLRNEPIGLLAGLRETLGWQMRLHSGILSVTGMRHILYAGYPDAESLPIAYVESLCRLAIAAYLCPTPPRVASQFRLVFAQSQKAASAFSIIVDSAWTLWKGDEARFDTADDAFAEAVADRLQEYELLLVAACIRADERFEGDNPYYRGKRRGLNQFIVEALREIGGPAHFTDVAETVNSLPDVEREYPTNSVHNKLCDHRALFVYVRPGTYGLTEWGMDDERWSERGRGFLMIPDLAIQYLEEKGRPMPKDDIVAYVTTRKRCRPTSVEQRLYYDCRFRQFERGMYGLATWSF